MDKQFERLTEITPAFDKRNPDPNKNYGIHGCELRMILKGELGAVQFVIYTNWMLPHVQEEQLHKYAYRDAKDIELFFLPMPADVGYHSPKSQYDEQTIASDNCPYLDGKPCYYDGSGLRAEKWFETLLSEGSNGIWKLLEEEYVRLFQV